jgi:hypothetical protein
MLSIILIHVINRRFRCPPYLITTIKVYLKFGGLKERIYTKRICLQILKTLREERNAIRELRRCDRGSICFSA